MCYNSGMNNGDLFDDFALEKSAKELFGVSLEIDKVIARRSVSSGDAISFKKETTVLLYRRASASFVE